MSIPVIDKLKPLGDFPIADSSDVDCGGKRLNSVLDEKANSSNVTAELNKKVDKVSGKGLSTNDYSDAEKAKVKQTGDDIARFNEYFTLV